MTKIEKLKAEVQRLETELGKAKTALYDALVEDGGFHAGEVVEARRTYGLGGRRDTDWHPAIIRKITVGWTGDHCHYVVSFPKKDGAWSKVEVDYDVEIRKPA